MASECDNCKTQEAELRTLRARVGELEAVACAAVVLADAGPGRTSGPMWTLLWTFLNDRIRRSLVPAMQRQGLPFAEHGGEWRSEPAPSLPSNLSNLAGDALRARAASAESRAQELERAFRNLVARIDGDGGQSQEGGTVAGSLERADTKVVTLQARTRELEVRVKELEAARLASDRITAQLRSRVEAYQAGLSQRELFRGLPLPRELEDAMTSLAKLVPVTLEPDQLDSYDCIAQRAERRITDLESQLAAAREEQELEAKVREVLGERFFQVRIARYHEFWQAEWRGVVRGETLERFADAETLPALLRAILEVEAKGAR